MAGEQLSTKVSLEVGDGAGTEAFTAIPGIIGIPRFPSPVYGTVDVTALDSSGAEYIATLPDAGEVDFTLNIRKKASGTGYIAAQAQLEGYAGDGAPHNFKMKIGSPITKTITFAALVLSFEESAPSANATITAAVKLKVTGLPIRS
jgi:hypothetical protein